MLTPWAFSARREPSAHVYFFVGQQEFQLVITGLGGHAEEEIPQNEDHNKAHPNITIYSVNSWNTI